MEVNTFTGRVKPVRFAGVAPELLGGHGGHGLRADSLRAGQLAARCGSVLREAQQHCRLGRREVVRGGDLTQPPAQPAENHPQIPGRADRGFADRS